MVDVSDQTDIKLQFWAKLKSFESSDKAYVKVSGDGSNWTTINTFVNGQDDNQYYAYSFEVPDLGDTLHVRFDAGMSSNRDYWYIDDVEVVGTPDNAPPIGLISYWSAENNALDGEGNNDGTLVSGASYATGQIGQSFYFDGIDDRVLIEDSASLRLTKSMTIEGWIRVDSFPTDGHGLILFRGDDRGGLDPYELTTTPEGNVRFGISSLSGGERVEAAMPQGEFVYVVATLDDATGEMSLYLNGVLMTQKTTSVRPFGALDAGSNPGIGIGNHGGFPSTPHNFPFHGSIDELKVHDVALTDSEVLANFNSGKGSLQPRLSISDVSIVEDETSFSFLDVFVSAGPDGLSYPGGMDFGPDGNLYISGWGSDNVLRYDSATGAYIDEFVVAGSGGLDVATGITFHNGDLYVVSVQTNAVLRYDGTTGNFIDTFIPGNLGGLELPRNLLFGTNNELFVTSLGDDDAVLRYDATTGAFLGEFISSGDNGLDDPISIILGPDGNYYVSSFATDAIYRYDSGGSFIDLFVASGEGGLDAPTSMFFDSGKLYVGSFGTDSVLSYDQNNGQFLGTAIPAGSGGLDGVGHMKFDSFGNLLVASLNSDEVLRFAEAGSAILTVSLSSPNPDVVTVDFSTADGSAIAGGDYESTTGTVTFAAGVMSQSVLVPILNDSIAESDEEFSITIANPTNATVVDAIGVVTIIDDGDIGNPPIAVGDAYVVNEDDTLNIAADGVLINDSDPEGDPLTAALVAGPANGSVTLNADGSFDYTPDANFNGSDSFTYVANDGTADSNVATVTITVNSINDAPVAANDNYVTDQDTPLVVTTPGLLGNDNDIDGDSLNVVVASVSIPANGSVSVNPDGSLTYTPDTGFFGSDSFTYLSTDGVANSNTATVAIIVNPVNNLPVAFDDNYFIDEDTTLNVVAPGILSNDTDDDGDPLTAVLVTGPGNGSLTLNADGSFDYSPNSNFNGNDSFTYFANDGTANSNTVTVSITVNSVNDVPVAAGENYTIDEDSNLGVTAPGVLAKGFKKNNFRN